MLQMFARVFFSCLSCSPMVYHLCVVLGAHPIADVRLILCSKYRTQPSLRRFLDPSLLSSAANPHLLSPRANPLQRLSAPIA